MSGAEARDPRGKPGSGRMATDPRGNETHRLVVEEGVEERLDRFLARRLRRGFENASDERKYHEPMLAQFEREHGQSVGLVYTRTHLTLTQYSGR